MITAIRTNATDPDFRSLVATLDHYLAVMDGDEHSYYAQYNKLDNIPHTVVVYDGDKPVGCGAIKEYSKDAVEVKRMFVHPDHRRQGIAKRILDELEQWAKELGYNGCILETGKGQHEAVALYLGYGYKQIPNYGQYEKMDNSICMMKYV